MSYAEQFFNLKGTSALNYADNLAWFGKESYVYSNEGMMLDVIKSPIALENPITALYAYLWARENGYKASELFRKGLIIGLYNSNIGETYTFKLYKFNEDGSANFISHKCGMCCTVVSANGGENYKTFLNLEDFDIVRYLNGGNHWYEDWTNKPAGVGTAATGGASTFWNVFKKQPGFLSGLSYDVVDMMQTFKAGQNIKICPLSYDDVTTDLKEEVGNICKVDRLTCKVIDKYIPTFRPSNFKVGNVDFWSSLLEDVTIDQIEKIPGSRGVVRLSSAVSVAQAQNDGSLLQIGNTSNLKFKIKL